MSDKETITVKVNVSEADKEPIRVTARVIETPKFLDIQADLPEEYHENDHPIDTICLWEKTEAVDTGDDMFGTMELINEYLEAQIHPYQDKFYVLFYHHTDGPIIDNVARLGLWDTIEELKATLKTMWPDHEIHNQ